MPRVLIIGTGMLGFAALRLANEGFEVEIITNKGQKDQRIGLRGIAAF